MATRRPSYSRIPSVSFSKQGSISSHNSDDLFEEPAAAQDRTDGEERDGIWNTTRRKLTLVSLCLVYFAATASFAILSPFFPGEVNIETERLSFNTILYFVQRKQLHEIRSRMKCITSPNNRMPLPNTHYLVFIFLMFICHLLWQKHSHITFSHGFLPPQPPTTTTTPTPAEVKVIHTIKNSYIFTIIFQII